MKQIAIAGIVVIVTIIVLFLWSCLCLASKCDDAFKYDEEG